jgi:hypothetical protein
MNENNESIKIFRCNICNKNYSSQSSLCNHNKKFHNKNSIPKCDLSIPKCDPSIPKCDPGIITCKYCNKIYANRHSKWKHQKNCKNNTEKICQTKDNTMDKKFEEFKNTILDIIQKEAKIHPKTLQKINKQLINNINNTNNTNNTTNNGTINNGTVINNTYVKFGNEQLAKLLTRKDMLKIINKQCLCIEESIKTVHFNKSLPEYSNIFITNMKDTIAYIFDGSRFILTSKDTVINDLYNSHLENIEQFLEEAEIPENKYTKITKFLDVLNDDDKSFIDGTNNNKKYPNYKAYKLIAIKNLIYNESDQKLLKKLNNIDLQEKINDVPITESDE